MSKTFTATMVIDARTNAGFSQTFSSAQAAVVGLQSKISAAAADMRKIDAYQKYGTAVDANTRKLANLQAQHDLLQQEIKESDSGTTTQRRKLLQLEQQIDNTTASLHKNVNAVDKLGHELSAAGYDMNDLRGESAKLEAKIGSLRAEQDRAAGSVRSFGAEFSALGGVLVSAGVFTLLRNEASALREITAASIEYESTLTGVYKTVDADAAQRARISKDIKQMSIDIPVATTEIAGVAEAAGQLGVATDNVTSFTETMLKLGVTTNMTANDAATDLAQVGNIMQASEDEYSRMGSTVVALGNNLATTESKIVDMSTRLAAGGKLANMTTPEIFGLSAAMSSVGIESEAGGTAMTQTLTAIEQAVAGGGDKLQQFARIAGMAPEQFASAWKSDAAGTLQAFITGLGKLDEQGESATLVLDEMGLSGIRQSNMLKSLALASEMMTDAMDLANSAWEENIALDKEAEQRFATTESSLTRYTNSATLAKQAIGDAFTPAIKAGSEVLIDFNAGLADFAEKNPAVVRGVGLVAGGISAAAGGLAAFNLAGMAVKRLNLGAMFAGPAGSIAGAVTLASVAVSALYIGYSNLTKQARENKAELLELTSATQTLTDTQKSAAAVYSDTLLQTKATAKVAEGYVDRLEELGDYGELSADQQEEFNDILKILCDTVPELRDNIDLETSSIKTSTDALRDNIRAWEESAAAQARRQQLSAVQGALGQAEVEAEANRLRLEQKKEEKSGAQAQKADIEKQLSNLYMQAQGQAMAEGGATADYLTQEYYDLQTQLSSTNKTIYDATNDIGVYTEAMNVSTEAVERARKEVELYQLALNNLDGQGGTEAVPAEQAAAAPANGRGFASGTLSAPPGWAWVGERGPELMRFAGGEKVLSAEASAAAVKAERPVLAALPGGSPTYNLNLSPSYNISGSPDAAELRRVLEEHDRGLLASVQDMLERQSTDRARRAYA